jgi:hypothetical protein
MSVTPARDEFKMRYAVIGEEMSYLLACERKKCVSNFHSGLYKDRFVIRSSGRTEFLGGVESMQLMVR